MRALAHIGETVTVTIPGPKRGFAKVAMQQRGLRAGSTRVVTATDARKNGADMFTGRFIRAGEARLPVGAVVMEQDPEGDRYAAIVLPDATLAWHPEGGASDRLTSLRERIDAWLASPLERMREIERERTAVLASRQRELDAHEARPRRREDHHLDRHHEHDGDRLTRSRDEGRARLDAIRACLAHVDPAPPAARHGARTAGAGA